MAKTVPSELHLTPHREVSDLLLQIMVSSTTVLWLCDVTEEKRMESWLRLLLLQVLSPLGFGNFGGEGSFRGKNEESVNLLCTDENEGEDCLAANVEMNKPEDQDKVLLHLVNMNMPVRPGILVQRQSKEATAPHLGENIEFEEDKNRQIFESANVRETNYKGGIVERTPMRATLTPSVIESQKRPLKGVTFSKEVIVVDLGNEYARPRSYAREHKERK
ncbi:hypothetical protein LTLLF_101810 [Microtus ochrogaster]|uniref:Uncharacterized protein n=1 Tax=Microtus ochrogaster TaxID=79684 RepID=A0A8J6H2J3_MICOH|nr:hypothetical protein LTLLF_101810 [Microtus ochrogaster]